MHAILATIAAISKEAQASLRPAQSSSPDETSLLDAIYSPTTAAAVFLVALAKASGPVSDATAVAIRDELRRLSGLQDVTELLVFSGWLTEHERSPSQIARKFDRLWRRALSKRKRETLVSAAYNIVASSGATCATQTDAVRALRERLV